MQAAIACAVYEIARWLKSPQYCRRIFKQFCVKQSGGENLHS
jgi:hypothetical protein